MNKYVYQKFLLNCDYESIEIADVPIYDGNIREVLDYTQDYCLFDVGKEVIRKINVAEIDEIVDNEEDWDNLIKKLNNLDTLILYNYRIETINPIIQSYREATLKAYLYRLGNGKQKIFLT